MWLWYSTFFLPQDCIHIAYKPTDHYFETNFVYGAFKEWVIVTVTNIPFPVLTFHASNIKVPHHPHCLKNLKKWYCNFLRIIAPQQISEFEGGVGSFYTSYRICMHLFDGIIALFFSIFNALCHVYCSSLVCKWHQTIPWKDAQIPTYTESLHKYTQVPDQTMICSKEWK